jgi:catechol 2,3-dioxygenase-like lactoylglutathione lyase family enzyme
MGMYDHVGLRVKDLNASVEFYSAALRPLGYVLCSQDASGASFGLPNQADLWLYPGNDSAGPSAHIALRASDRNVVNSFHKEGLRAGGRDNGAPGVREDYGPRYYAAYVLDPDGNNVEAVCTQ